MEEYAKVLNIAIPVFLVLIAIEHGAALLKNRQINRLFDVISSLSSGMTNVIKDVMGLSIVILSYGWLYEHLALIQLESTLALYILAFIGLDFSGYWIHRWCHKINVFWNRHIIHHSSEEFNLSCALRQSVSEVFAIFTFTYIPMAILGIPPTVIAVLAPLHLFAQFWYHTRLIDRMGWLETWLVTPSHHRVHHAINPEYMDRNYGQIFILWDKWFGTFQEEKNEIPPVYGVTRPVRTWNPWLINYMHFWLLCKDAWRTASWRDKVLIWFKPTGWRPADVSATHPVNTIQDVHKQIRYHTQASGFLKTWVVLQLFVTLGLMMFFFNSLGSLQPVQILLYGLFLFVVVFGYTSLMDGSILGLGGEIAKAIFGITILQMQGGSWFGLGEVVPYGDTIFLAYLILSVLASLYFYYLDRARPEWLAGRSDVLTA